MAFQFNKVYVGNCLDVLKTFPDNSVQMCVTSPPYWGKRDYENESLVWGREDCEHVWESEWHEEDKDHEGFCSLCGAWRGCLGQEPTIELYLEHLVLIFAEVQRVLRDDGTLWVNMGDVYAHTGACGGGSAVVSRDYADTGLDPVRLADKSAQKKMRKGTMSPGLKQKDLAGLPWRVAFALRDAGWYLRADNIWGKTNPKPAPFTDRPAMTHEYVFLFSQRESYFYDPWAVLEPASTQKHSDKINRELNKMGKLVGRNRRSIWMLPCGRRSGEHVAVFSEEIPRIAISAGTSEKGACGFCGTPLKREVKRLNNDVKGKKSWEARAVTAGWRPGCECYEEGQDVPCLVLDPFMGQGTTAAAAEELGRSWIGVDMAEASVESTRKMISKFIRAF